MARPVATSYNEMTSAMITEMSAQLARMGQLAIDVENLKSRNAVLEAELAQVNKVRRTKTVVLACPMFHLNQPWGCIQYFEFDVRGNSCRGTIGLLSTQSTGESALRGLCYNEGAIVAQLLRTSLLSL